MKGLQTYLADMEGARQEGREEGDREARRELARALLEMGDDLEKVIRVTKLSKEEVEAIRREMAPEG